MKFNKVVVTGGAGFLGSRIVRRLLDDCAQIIVIDNLSTGLRKAVPDAENVKFVFGSITDEDLLEDILPGTELVFHMACANLVLSAEDMDRDFRTNLYGSYLVYKKSLELCGDSVRVVYASTASVYGNAEVLPTPESYYRISLPYSASKFSAEHYGKVFYEMHGLPVLIARFSNVYGPGQSPGNPYCGVVSKFFTAMSRGEPMIIYGDGRQTRDFTYVDDALDALFALVAEPKAWGDVFNIGTGVETSVLELARAAARAAGHEHYPVMHMPLRKVDKVVRRAMDVTKIRRLAGWQARTTLDEGLRKTCQWLFGGEDPN